MSSSVSPWLSKAVEDYRNKHRVNLSFEHKGGYVQLVQFTSYRDKRKPEYDQLGVWAYLHDKQYRVLVKFEASAINEFERTHESFTSYKGGLFQIRAFRFQCTSSYVDRVPSSAQIDLGPKERKLVLSVHSFRYLSSKGESDWSPSARSFDVLAAAWIRDILLDEEEKKGSSIGAYTALNRQPAQDDIVTAVADEARRKVMRKGGNARQATNPVHEGIGPSPLQPNAISASTSTPKQNVTRVTPLSESPSLRQNFSPDFISARKLVQHQNAAEQTAADSAGSTPTRLASVPTTSKAIVAENVSTHTGKRNRSVDDQDGLDLESPEPEQMFTQFSEEAAPISDPPPPSSHASSRSISPESEGDAVQPKHMNVFLETQGLSIDTQERIRTLFRPSKSNEKTPESRQMADVDKAVEAPASPLPGFQPSHPMPGSRKRKKTRLPQFELSSQLSGDEQDEETILQDDEEGGLLSAELEIEILEAEGMMVGNEGGQPLDKALNDKPESEQVQTAQGLDTEMEDTGKSHEVSPPAAEADVTVRLEVSEVIGNEDGNAGEENRQKTSDQVQDLRSVFETQSETSGAESGSDEGFEFVKLVPGLLASDARLYPIIKQEPIDSEAILTEDPGLPDKSQPPAVSVEAERDAQMSQHPQTHEITLEEDSNLVAMKTPALDADSLLNSLHDIARDESAAEYNYEVQVVPSTTREEGLCELLNVYRAFARFVQKDWLDRAAAAKVAREQSGSKRRRPVYHDDADPASNEAKSRSSSSGKDPSSALAGQRESVLSRTPADDFAKDSAHKRTQASFPQPEPRRKSSEAPARRRSNNLSAEKSKARDSSVASSAGQIARLSKAVQQQINETQALIKRNIRSIGLGMKDSVDLWYSCSGDFEIAKRIALHDVAKSQASEGSQDLSILPPGVQTAYKSCWAYEDDQVVETSSKNAGPQHKLALADIELRKGKGSVEKRRIFLKEDPIAKRLPRKPRYPFNTS